jgi:hypothetical protein
VAHPGFEWRRLSFHTLKGLACPRYAYFKQILGIRNKPYHTGETGARAAGKAFHLFMEVHYQPEATRMHPLPGMEGSPVIPDVTTAVDWLLDNGYAPSAVDVAHTAYRRYVEHWSDDVLQRDRLGRPEMNINGDLRGIIDAPKRSKTIPYSSQYDMVVRSAYPAQTGDVASVEHKLVGSVEGRTIAHYRGSGQIIGHCALWNSRKDLVSTFGQMQRVVLNLVCKGKRARFHRETVFIDIPAMQRFARATRATQHFLDQRMHRYRYAKTTEDVAGAWPQLGLNWGQCVPWIGRPCEFLEMCTSGEVVPELYQIAEPFHQRAADDGLVRVPLGTETYVPEAPTTAPTINGKEVFSEDPHRG